MSYTIVRTKAFDRKLKGLNKYFPKTSQSDLNEVRLAILDAIELLQINGELPDGYNDHVLTRQPWRGFNEFHALDDILVVYFKVDTRGYIRLVDIVTHAELHQGIQSDK